MIININIIKMITSLSQDIAGINKRSSLQDYEIVYTKLNDFIDKVNEKIVSRIQLVQQVYLDDYKQQVSIMSTQLRSIRAVLDEQVLKQKSNQKMFYLEEERDFFRAQVIKLNQDLRKMVEQNNKLKTKLSQTKQQCANFKKLVFDLQNRIYKITYENIEIERIKEQEKQSKKFLTTNLTTPAKGFYSQRDNHNLQKSQRSNYQGKDQNELRSSHTNSQAKLERQKTQYSLRKLKPSHSIGGATKILRNNFGKQTSSRQQILDSCIKQLKKQIFYRNLETKQTKILHFDQENSVGFDKFTKSDKKQLVYRFMSNPQILQEFYRFVFLKQINKLNKEQDSNTALQKIALAKGIDSRYNAKMLANVKAQFDKRIYDIKVNRY